MGPDRWWETTLFVLVLASPLLTIAWLVAVVVLALRIRSGRPRLWPGVIVAAPFLIAVASVLTMWVDGAVGEFRAGQAGAQLSEALDAQETFVFGEPRTSSPDRCGRAVAEHEIDDPEPTEAIERMLAELEESDRTVSRSTAGKLADGSYDLRAVADDGTTEVVFRYRVGGQSSTLYATVTIACPPPLFFDPADWTPITRFEAHPRD